MKSCAKSTGDKRSPSALNNGDTKWLTRQSSLESLSTGKGSDNWKSLKEKRRPKGADSQMNGKRPLNVHISSGSSNDADEFSSSIRKKSRISVDTRASGDCNNDTIGMDTSNSQRSSQTINTSKRAIATISTNNFLNKVGSSSLSSQHKGVPLRGRNEFNKASKGHKRGRLAVLDSSDSGGESDLFDFGDAKLSHRSPKKFHSTGHVTNANENSPDGAPLRLFQSTRLESSGSICYLPKPKEVAKKLETKCWIDSRKRNTKVEIKKSEYEPINVPFQIQKLKNDNFYKIENDNVNSSARPINHRNFKLFTKNRPVLGEKACVVMISVVVDPRDGAR